MYDKNYILTINAGSSSIKFALFKNDRKLYQIISGSINRIGLSDTTFIVKHIKQKKAENKIDVLNFRKATQYLIEWFEKQEWFKNVGAIGHRIVHGLKHPKAEVITVDLLNELQSISDWDPDHLPEEIKIIQSIREKNKKVLHIACFDTAFHITMPDIAKKFAIPKKYFEEGIQRYGFHGISYSYLMQQLIKKGKKQAAGCIILAHLGNGASIAAVKSLKCIDTSMGFTPAGGIVMGTRSGDIDPGIAWYLTQKGMNAKKFNNLINHESGLIGISGYSSDMQYLLQQEKQNTDAALAIDIFCYQVKKYIGAYTAALGGLDTIVFSGGIGENAPEVRERISNALQFLGIELDEKRNANNEEIISTNNSKVTVRVIKTNEELMIAKLVCDILNYLPKN